MKIVLTLKKSCPICWGTYRGSTLFLKLTLLFLSIGVLFLCAYIFFILFASTITLDYKEILVGVFLTTIPLLHIFQQSYKLLILIDKNSSLTYESVKSLKNITSSSFIISGMYLLGSPFIYLVAEKDDAPGLIIVNLVFIMVPFVVGVFSTILQKLLINAISYKSETELTI